MVEFELRKTDGGQFNFSLKNSADKTLLKSEQYNSKSSAQNGIESVRNNAGNPAHYELKKPNRACFILTSRLPTARLLAPV